MTTFCFGVLCPQHGTCDRYQGLDGLTGDYEAISNCGPGRPLFKPMTTDKTDYSTLDKQILDVITTEGSAHYEKISGAVWNTAKKLCLAAGRPTFRVIDGRLQSMRKSNKIRYDRRNGWSIVVEGA